MKILYIHESVPRPDKSGCDLRLAKTVDALLNAKHAVTLLARFPTAEQHYADELRSRGIDLELGTEPEDAKAYAAWCDGPESRFRMILRKSYDAAVLPLWFWRHLTIPDDFLLPIRIHSPSTRILVLTDDRQGYRQELVANLTVSFVQYELSIDFSEREALYYRSADAVLTISEEEAAYVRRLAPSRPVFCIPFSATAQSRIPDFASRHGLLFLADFDNFAGRDAMHWFIDNVWPIILERAPLMHLSIAGNRSERALQRAVTNVSCIGHVSDLRKLFKTHRLFVSPLRIGSGIATKNVLAMSHGLPIITTPVGIQGLGNPGSCIVVSPLYAPDFAAAILNHYEDQTWWSRSSIATRAHIADFFSPLGAEASLNAALSETMHYRDGLKDPADELLLANPYPVRDRSGFGQIVLADSLLAQGDIKRAFRQFRYALYRLQFQGAGGRQNYLRTLRGLRECYTRSNDMNGVHRCTEEKVQAQRGYPFE